MGECRNNSGPRLGPYRCFTSEFLVSKRKNLGECGIMEHGDSDLVTKPWFHGMCFDT